MGALLILTAIFSGNLVISAVLASKIIQLWFIAVPAGVLAYSVSFIVTDVVSEVYGKKEANDVVFAGFITLIIIFLLIFISIKWPPASFWHNQKSFETILGQTARIIIASLLAYLVSQYHDVWAFHFWKKITKGRHLWLRNCASTIVSQLIDSIIFITIAFYGIMPIFPIIMGQWIVKVTIALLDTPLVYAIVYFLNGKFARRSILKEKA